MKVSFAPELAPPKPKVKPLQSKPSKGKLPKCKKANGQT
jgi:hypothetical protein